MTRVDGGLLLAAVLFVAGLYALLWQPGDTGRTARVSVDGDVVTTLDLRRDGEHTVTGRLGKTRLQVADGRIRVTESPGARQLCVRDGWLTRAGASTVCLPNRVVVEITGRADHGLDGETF
ncbi:NusG domain II-containing protein [Aquisalimonas asiatica]|uniref:NusG domain II n=1 Tax=Aquisalimonas asiatica TaxID=406100 RepID=A0A1H8TQ18_9GAMM|nr:NusG domain II-containing protein [Aquisalimonas asiatica]SEO92965.1 NusG domain II [Aquisalimonas asiatica]